MANAVSGAVGKQVSFERERGVQNITVTPDIAHVVISLGSEGKRTEGAMNIFRSFADANIPIFLIKLHRNAVSFAFEGADFERSEACLKTIGFEYALRRDLARILIMASSIRDLTGVMVRIADALQQAGARLYGVGDSHNSVQCLINGSRADAAVQQLSSTFGLEEARG